MPPRTKCPECDQHESKCVCFRGDCSQRFAMDTLLRKHGWRIVTRKYNNPKWEKDGIVLDEEEALGCISYTQIKEAELREQLYWKGVT
jgi:hypothetical protein